MKPDKKLLPALNQKLPITERPFKIIAEHAGMQEKKFLSLLKQCKKTGLMRRFGVFLNHRKIGLKANALIAWKVESKEINRVAKILTGFPEVSHCYLRTVQSPLPKTRPVGHRTAVSPIWPYNVYTMLHAENKKECKKIIELMSQKTGIQEYRVMWTIKELKKTKTDLKILRN